MDELRQCLLTATLQDATNVIKTFPVLSLHLQHVRYKVIFFKASGICCIVWIWPAFDGWWQWKSWEDRWTGQTLTPEQPGMAWPHAVRIITQPQPRPVVPPWLMGSTRPNSPMEAFHPDCSPAHPSWFPSRVVLQYVSETELLSLNPTPWLNGLLCAVRRHFWIVY